MYGPSTYVHSLAYDLIAVHVAYTALPTSH